MYFDWRRIPNLIEYVKPHFPEVVGINLVSKHPDEYSSFKISVSEEHYQAALDPNFWPRNACVKRFFTQTGEATQVKNSY